MALYGRQAQGLGKKHTEFSYLLADLPAVPKREPKATTPDKKVLKKNNQNLLLWKILC